MSGFGLDRLLFSPKFNNGMAALDDQTSMFSVAARDAAGSSGRVLIEYKRDKHGGRERLLEEGLTLAIWGFGVRAIKQTYDAAMLGPLQMLNVKLPDLDTGMLPQKPNEAIKPGSQVLTEPLVGKFAERFKHNAQYTELLKVVDVAKNPALKRTYQISSLAKFGAASILPAVAIAFGVPTLNQHLTRQLLDKEEKTKQSPAKPSPSGVGAHNPPARSANSAWATPAPKSPWGNSPLTHHTTTPLANLAPSPGTVTPAPTPQGFGANAPMMKMQPLTSQQALVQPGMQPMLLPQLQSQSSSGHPVRFGGLGSLAANAASTVLQNEQWNTLLIDGVISGGRTYKARNHVERTEIIFREATLIAFLYWAQGKLQNGINAGLGKWWNIPSNLGFKDLQYLKKQASNSEFLQQYNNATDKIGQKMEESLKKEMAGNLTPLHAVAGDADLKTKALLDTIHDYFLTGRDVKAGKTNMLFETAIESGLIPTFKEEATKAGLYDQLKGIVKELDPTKERKLTENDFLDLTKKINTSGVFELQKSLGEIAEKARTTELPHLLNKVMRLRAGSLVASNLACFGALSFVFPEMQHWITYKMTGKNYFPGVPGSDKAPANKLA